MIMLPTAERFQCELDELEFDDDVDNLGIQVRDPFTGLSFDESKVTRDDDGKFASHPGSVHGASVRIKSTTKRAYAGKPVITKMTLTKQETGRVGEAVCVAWLKANAAPDARAMNTDATNFPVDLIEDHAPTEVKTGLCSNSPGAQKWRLTFSKESTTEKKLYAKMSPRQRKLWNAKKQARVRERKEKVLKQFGNKAKPRTMCVIVNPDTRVADVYVFDGWHDVLRWNSDETKLAYRGSVRYGNERAVIAAAFDESEVERDEGGKFADKDERLVEKISISEALSRIPDLDEMAFDAGIEDLSEYNYAEIQYKNPSELHAPRFEVYDKSHKKIAGELDVSRPIGVFSESGHLLDGWHRVQKALLDGHDSVPVWVLRKGKDREDLKASFRDLFTGMLLAGEFDEHDRERDDHGRWTSGGPSTVSHPAPNPYNKSDLVPGADATRGRRHSTDVAKRESYARSRTERFAKRFGQEQTTAPPPGERGKDYHEPTDAQLQSGEMSRVGVMASEMPPPPDIPRLPRLTVDERAAESAFAEACERDPDLMAHQYLELVRASKDPKVFETDGAKVLSGDWNSDDPAKQAELRARYNTPLHQTANAITKRAFVKHLDTLKPGDEVLVTCGGCGSGKGYALDSIPEVKAMKAGCGAVWDSAGDQNATENTWVLEQARSRGLRVTYVFVHANPEVSWADPERGVVQRANDPKNGRMVDAAVFADSYALGAENHSRFHAAHAQDPDVSFVFIDNSKSGSTPTRIDAMPGLALSHDAATLREFAERTVSEREDLRPAVKRGAMVGARVWPVKKS